MDARETQLRVLLEGQKQFVIPLFQRTYSWGKEQWGALWRDILETYELGAGTRHFLGSIVTKSLPGTPHGVSPFLVIDGQQRLITLTILLAALRDAIPPVDDKTAAKIQELYLTNRFVPTPDIYKVLPTQTDRTAYFRAIETKDLEEGPSRITEAYRYFRDALRTPDGEDKQLDLPRLEQVVLSGLEVVSITLGDVDNEYRIFESLNAKGAPLTQADLLRNYFFMRIPLQDQETVYGASWLPMQVSLGEHLEDFFRYQYMSGGEFLREGDVYQRWKLRLDKLIPNDLVKELQALVRMGSHYKCLVEPQSEPTAQVRQRLERLNRWGGQTMYPFLLWVYSQKDAGQVDDAGIAQILLMIESFLVRRLFCGVPTTALNRLFARLPQQLPKDKPISEGTRLALSEPGRRWPRDAVFREAVLKYPLYTDSRPEQRRLILETLELSYQHKEPVSFADLSIEHVMPQNLTGEWRVALGDGAEEIHRKLVHTLGNLTLSGYNPDMSDRPFQEKRAVFASSHLSMNKEIAARDTWTGEEMLQRSRGLAEKAIRIWPGPLES